MARVVVEALTSDGRTWDLRAYEGVGKWRLVGEGDGIRLVLSDVDPRPPALLVEAGKTPAKA